MPPLGNRDASPTRRDIEEHRDSSVGQRPQMGITDFERHRRQLAYQQQGYNTQGDPANLHYIDVGDSEVTFDEDSNYKRLELLKKIKIEDVYKCIDNLISYCRDKMNREPNEKEGSQKKLEMLQKARNSIPQKIFKPSMRGNAHKISNYLDGKDCIEKTILHLIVQDKSRESQQDTSDTSKASATTLDTQSTLEQKKQSYLESIPQNTLKHLRERTATYENPYSFTDPDEQEISKRKKYREIKFLCAKIELGCNYITNAASRGKMLNLYGQTKKEEAIEYAIELKKKLDELPHIPGGITDAVNLIKQLYQDAGLD